MKSINLKFDKEHLLDGEWLLTNGIGGFACGNITGTLSRKSHSLLNAALPNPYGRTVMLNYAAEFLVLADGTEIPLSQLQFQNKSTNLDFSFIEDFQLENDLPVWIFNVNGIRIEKRIILINRQNTIHISYKLLSEDQEIEIKWSPFLHFRMIEEAVDTVIPNEAYNVHIEDGRLEIICPNYPPLKIFNPHSAAFVSLPQTLENVFYETEAARGYTCYGNLKSPGYFHKKLDRDGVMTLIISTESWETIKILGPEEALICDRIRKRHLIRNAGKTSRLPLASQLVLAADQFIITPTTRFEDGIRLQALGEEARTIIAGFPWFGDWGRDTMISLEGLTLATGRSHDAFSILHTFAYYIKDGLIPNMFPEGKNQGIYNTSDATLWFFHAISRYINYTGDDEILLFILPKLHDIIQHHITGTRFGIKMDSDGLLTQGEKGYQLTWMDAKVGDWVVTPRRGKAVEINALWYNALRLYEKWSDKSPEISDLCYESFNKKFWFEEGKYLYDVIDGEEGNDSALRPNQLFAISLDYPVLDHSRWGSVLSLVKENLLTPAGLRTLSPSHPQYKLFYEGNLLARDAAYHQGTVWPWLLGPYIDVWLKVFPDKLDHPKEILKGMEDFLNSNCVGTIGEIFDAGSPYKARGCFAQAWSVAEILRSLVKVYSL